MAPIAAVPCQKGLLKVELSRALSIMGQFDLATGEARGPQTAESLKTYEFRVEDADIFISII
jgi:hypothetical protein